MGKDAQIRKRLKGFHPYPSLQLVLNTRLHPVSWNTLNLIKRETQF